MKIQQFAVVHLVNVVPAKDQYILWIFPFNRINVLIHGIGCSLIPLFRGTELGRYRKDEFATIVREDVPAQTNMAVKRIGFVLCKDADSLQLRVDTVRQSKVYNSINSTERNDRFRPVFRQRV